MLSTAFRPGAGHGRRRRQSTPRPSAFVPPGRRWATGRTFVLWLATLAIGSCGGEAPSPTASSTPSPTEPTLVLSCWSVEPGDCDRVANEGLARLPGTGRPVVAASVHRGFLRAEFADGGGIASVDWSLDPGQPAIFGAWRPDTTSAIAPRSGPLLTLSAEVVLGHCGLYSPIDVDGALWDPRGPVDAAAPEHLNSTRGEFRLTGRTTAEFVAPSGFRVALSRHVGRKSVPTCD